jgi:two-component system, OmpR family, response regulator MprA
VRCSAAQGTAVPETILIVEDDRSVAEMLRRNFAYEGFRVDVAGDGQAGIERARDRGYDLIVLDVMLPALDGFEVLRRIRQAGDQTPVLMLTARDAVDDRVAGLQGGADDYLVKPFAFKELLARVDVLLRRQRNEDREVLRFADLGLDTGSRQAIRGGRAIDLSTTEYELLAYLMRHPNQVLPRDRIVERVWGYDFEGESNVLEVYVGYLRRKLEEGGEPRLIQTVRGAGYVLREGAS